MTSRKKLVEDELESHNESKQCPSDLSLCTSCFAISTKFTTLPSECSQCITFSTLVEFIQSEWRFTLTLCLKILIISRTSHFWKKKYQNISFLIIPWFHHFPEWHLCNQCWLGYRNNFHSWRMLDIFESGKVLRRKDKWLVDRSFQQLDMQHLQVHYMFLFLI